MNRRAGFTLLEILMAMVIGLLLVSVAVPSLMGMVREEKLKKVFNDFDAFVQQTQMKAVKDRQTYVMVWEPQGIQFQTLDKEQDEALTPGTGATDESGALTGYSFAEGSTWTLERPAALVKDPVWEWPFWRNGLCESVRVKYEGPEGTWAADYNGLTARGKLTDMIVK